MSTLFAEDGEEENTNAECEGEEEDTKEYKLKGLFLQTGSTGVPSCERQVFNHVNIPTKINNDTKLLDTFTVTHLLSERELARASRGHLSPEVVKLFETLAEYQAMSRVIYGIRSSRANVFEQTFPLPAWCGVKTKNADWHDDDSTCDNRGCKVKDDENLI